MIILEMGYDLAILISRMIILIDLCRSGQVCEDQSGVIVLEMDDQTAKIGRTDLKDQIARSRSMRSDHR